MGLFSQTFLNTHIAYIMSSRKGSGLTRTRAQKHKNSFAFKNDLHDKTPQQKLINSLNICEVCERCKAQIEWRIKYKKYKPLSQARTCIRYVILNYAFAIIRS